MLVIDNYDSFVYNLVQELGELGADPVVHRNDAIDVDGIRAAAPDAILISPGPGPARAAPASAWRSSASWPASSPSSGCASGTRPSARSTAARSWPPPPSCTARPRPSTTTGPGVFAGLPDPFVATRYHSLVVEPASVPDVLEVTATTADGVIMGLRHRTLAVEGVQFHPESLLTPEGPTLLSNFLAVDPARLTWTRPRPGSRPEASRSSRWCWWSERRRTWSYVVVVVVDVVVVVVGGGPVETR